MADSKVKRQNWVKKRRRVKKTLKIGSLPRLVVYRSNSHIYGQIVDDHQGVTLASASSNDKALKEACVKAESKIERSKLVGETLGEKAKTLNIESVIFDRNGYKYHGRVKALADAVRKAGIQL